MSATEEDIYSEIATALSGSGLYSADAKGDALENTWRISTEPYFLSTAEFEFIDRLGQHLLKFNSALNQCYLDSAKGKLPAWVSQYLDAGKPQDLIDYSRMKRFKNALPGIIRPDLIVTEEGFSVTELDSVPGGFGLTARLMSLYQTDENNIIGHEKGGIPELFYQMTSAVAGVPNGVLGIIVSDEAKDYLSEMVYLADLLRQKGVSVFTVHPRDVIFRENGLFVLDGDSEVRLDVVYRFYELFDLKNIPKSELFLYSNKKGQVQTTPPYKPFLEEKLSFALFHHPSLAAFWEKALGPETFAVLSHLIPETWILDDREIPPHGVIPGLKVDQTPIRDWRELFPLSQKQREYAIKPSGFSPLSWGSRGVVIGHDVSSAEWQETLENSLAQFPHQPSILQEFHKGKTVVGSYYRPETGTMVEMKSRVRLTPYYFVVEGNPKLGGILATLCPHDKKKIHGMVDAIMVPCAVRG